MKATLFISLGWFLLAGWAAAAEPPYLLLRFTDSYRDNSVVGRRFARFTDMNKTNACTIGWPSRRNETNAARIEAILTAGLEKEATRDTRGTLWWKARSEIVFRVPVESIQLLYGWPTNLALVTDFSGWRLTSPTQAETEKSETLLRLLEARTQTQAGIEAYADNMMKSDKGVRDEPVDAIWKGVWESGDPKIKEPKIDKLSEADVVQRMIGTWTVMFGVIPDKLMISLSANRLVEVSGRKEGTAWKKSGQWRVISDKLVLFLKEDKLPSFVFVTEQRTYIFDPWAKTMMLELKQEK